MKNVTTGSIDVQDVSQDERRAALQPYNNAKVKITGLIERLPFPGDGHNDKYASVLAIDVELVTLDNKNFYLGHAWIQKCYELLSMGVKKGDRFTCWCRVCSYKKDVSQDGTDYEKQAKCYGLQCPTEIEVKKNPSRYQPAVQIPAIRTGPLEVEEVAITTSKKVTPVTPAKSGRETQKELVAIAKTVGGMAKLQELLDKVQPLADECGWAALREEIEFLNSLTT
jgi:hypothetical protein